MINREDVSNIFSVEGVPKTLITDNVPLLAKLFELSAVEEQHWCSSKWCSVSKDLVSLDLPDVQQLRREHWGTSCKEKEKELSTFPAEEETKTLTSESPTCLSFKSHYACLFFIFVLNIFQICYSCLAVFSNHPQSKFSTYQSHQS